MDKKQTYNEQEQFRDHPLPDAGQSWEKMKQLLDEEDNNRKPVVPLFLKSCAGWGFLLLLTGAVAWFLLKPGVIREQKLSVQPRATHENSLPSNNNKTRDEATTTQAPSWPSDINSSENNPEQQLNVNTIQSGSGTPAVTLNRSENRSIPKNKSTIGTIDQTSVNKDSKSTKRNNELQQQNSGMKNGEQVSAVNPESPITKKNDASIEGVRIEPALEIRDSLSKKEAVLVRDTTSMNADSSKIQQKKKIVKSKPAFLISAGIGMQQQVPVGDQKAVAQNYYGRTSALSDYIPSLYLRVEKEKKWFVQGEFRYGAPQSLKEFSFNRQTKLDSTSSFITTTSLVLKKTYYHQFPFSFNYYVLPNWSVGAGGIYSRFHGAVTETETRNRNILSQAETVSKKLVNIKHFTDSFLYKTQMHVLLQTEYHWKRFSFGLRYTRDVQPFIKYIKPDGNVNTEKNQTIQLMARFRIWQSQRKALRK